jgi:hypothetical protein
MILLKHIKTYLTHRSILHLWRGGDLPALGPANRAWAAAYRTAGAANRPQPPANRCGPVDPPTARLTAPTARHTADRERLRGTYDRTGARRRTVAGKSLGGTSRKRHGRGEHQLGIFWPPKRWAEVGLAGPPYFFFFLFGLTCNGWILY